MSIEYTVVDSIPELFVVTDEPTEARSPAHLKEVGSHSMEFDGFVMLEMVDSPYEHIRQELAAKVVDQDPAIDAIVEAIDRTPLRLPGDHRPLASLAFLGPTGVGKSETAKTLAALMTEGSGNLIKVDCSSFPNGHEIASLVGSPPGYVGYNISPQFAQDKVEKPGTVILFDEIEKGSDELYNLMLQIMGDGQLQLARGDVVSFRDTIIILTSNLGAKEMSDQLSTTPLGFAENNRPKDKASLERTARKSFVEHFRPEFVNRLNKVVVFHPLNEEGLGRVLDVKLAEANDHYEGQYGVRLSLSPETRAHLVSTAVKEPHLGARPLIRALEDNVQSMLGRYTSSGALPEGTHVRVVHRDEVPQAPTSSTSQLLFTAQRDTSIHKLRPPLALPAAKVESVPDEPGDSDNPA